MTYAHSGACCGYKTRAMRDYDTAKISHVHHTAVFFLKKLLEYLVILCIGGAIYYGVEILYRGYSHWSMFLTGGICLIAVGIQNELRCMGKIGIIPQMAIGSVLITVIEFIVGCIVNLWLGWGIWDYSNLPFNILGQVCIPFMFAWFFLAGLAIFVDDWIRVAFFDEAKPHYDLIYCRHGVQ